MAQADVANLIEQRIDELVEVWVNKVRQDECIKSDADLSDGGLINHVPIMLEEVCSMLRSKERPNIHNTQEARVHAYTRFRQGYRARDLVREISLLRLTLMDHIGAQLFEPTTETDARSFIESFRSINLYIDEELRYAVSIYTEETK